EEHAVVEVHRVDGEVLDRAAGDAHPAGHALATEHATGRRGATDRAGLAVVAVRTVGGAHAGEAVTLHDAGEALALGRAHDVDALADLEGPAGQLLADLVLTGVRRADLGDVATGRDAGGVETLAQR